jgi:hypothetical protein
MPIAPAHQGNFDAIMDEISKISIANIENPRRPKRLEIGDKAIRYAPIVNQDQTGKFNTKFKATTVMAKLGDHTYKCMDADGTITICDAGNLRKLHI